MSTLSDLSPHETSAAVTRIGAVSYLNTKPLIYGLEDAIESRARLQLQIPSRLADDLHSGQLDIGLIPVVESFGHPDYRIVSNAVIACRGPVWSVRIFFRCEPEQVRTLARHGVANKCRTFKSFISLAIW